MARRSEADQNNPTTAVTFRELSGGSIGVISILHENMDLPARLKDDAARSEEE